MKYFLLFLLLLTPLAAQAQSDAPVEISAARSLEWDRNAKTYTARGKAHAKQGTFEVSSDTLTAFYSDSAGSTDISQIVADGNVVLTSPPYKGYGDKAVYDVLKNGAVLTGTGLKIATDSETLTAEDKIEFFGTENRLTATGKAVAVRGTDTLKADVINAFFKENAQGKLSLEKITAVGDVVITTAKETVHGDHGTYDVIAEKSVVTGKVKMYQGENWLEGTRAEVDLKTGLSRLFAPDNAETEGRVKGVFYPKKSGQ